MSSEDVLPSNFKYGQMYYQVRVFIFEQRGILTQWFQDCVTAACHWLASYGGQGVRCLKTPTDFRVKVKEGLEKFSQDTGLIL